MQLLLHSQWSLSPIEGLYLLFNVLITQSLILIQTRRIVTDSV